MGKTVWPIRVHRISGVRASLQSFPGLIDPNTRIPPDTQGAAEPDHLVSILNTEFAIFNKSTGSMLRGFPIDMRAFWAPLGDGPGEPAENPFDPKILFDQYSQRWILAADSISNNAAAAILIAVSSGYRFFPSRPEHRYSPISVSSGWPITASHPFSTRPSS